jgi:hypothetical protein
MDDWMGDWLAEKRIRLHILSLGSEKSDIHCSLYSCVGGI